MYPPPGRVRHIQDPRVSFLAEPQAEQGPRARRPGAQLYHGAGAPAAAQSPWRDCQVDAYDAARGIEPQQVEREAHEAGVDGAGRREEQSDAWGEVRESGQPHQACVCGGGHSHVEPARRNAGSRKVVQAIRHARSRHARGSFHP